MVLLRSEDGRCLLIDTARVTFLSVAYSQVPQKEYYVKLWRNRLHQLDNSWQRRVMATNLQPVVDRFLIAAIVDRLIYGSETTFQSEDARALLDALPRHRSPWFEFGVAGKVSGGSAKGYAAGVGDVKVQDDKGRKFEYSTAKDAYVRAGQWKLMWVGGRGCQYVDIEQVMADFTDEGRGARIRYAPDGTPLGMDIQINRSFRVLWSPLIMVFPGWRKWKVSA
jgi:hypothetical protein